MTLTSFVSILCSVTISAIGQIFLKIGLNSLHKSGAAEQLSGPLKEIGLALTTPGVIAGLGCYAIGTLLWLNALARVELSQAYPFVGIGFMLTTLAGWWIFDDHLSSERVSGIGVVLLGIALLART
jgi:multidrug transporter EmrE-like cation transporter